MAHFLRYGNAKMGKPAAKTENGRQPEKEILKDSADQGAVMRREQSKVMPSALAVKESPRG